MPEFVLSVQRCFSIMDVLEFNLLLNRALTDKSAFSTLYKFYYPRIILHIRRTYPKVDAEEVAQEFFLNLMKRKSYQFVKNPASWIYASCKNIIIRNHSKTEKEIAVVQENFGSPFSETLRGLNFERLFENADLVERIFASIDDETAKKIIYLYYWEGYNLREIAAILKMKTSTVKQKYRRAIIKIKKNNVSDRT